MNAAHAPELLLYTHDDGRTAVVASVELADFAAGDPGWHRAPVDIVRLGEVDVQPVARARPASRFETLTLHDIAPVAQGLVAEAERLGLVLTVEQRPMVPPAAGAQVTVVSVRAARVTA